MTASAESVDGPAPAYLTFDDGPDPSSTPEVLAALARVDARATFFVLGSRVRQHPDLVEAMVAAGHGVELHGHAHVSHEDLSPAEIERDLEEGLAALAQAGVYPARWRTPYGSTTDATFDVAAARGLALTGWTSDPRDWAGTSASAMLAALDQVLGAHAVVVLHDGVLDEGMRADSRRPRSTAPGARGSVGSSPMSTRQAARPTASAPGEPFRRSPGWSRSTATSSSARSRCSLRVWNLPAP